MTRFAPLAALLFLLAACDTAAPDLTASSADAPVAESNKNKSSTAPPPTPNDPYLGAGLGQTYTREFTPDGIDLLFDVIPPASSPFQMRVATFGVDDTHAEAVLYEEWDAENGFVLYANWSKIQANTRICATNYDPADEGAKSEPGAREECVDVSTDGGTAALGVAVYPSMSQSQNTTGRSYHYLEDGSVVIDHTSGGSGGNLVEFHLPNPQGAIYRTDGTPVHSFEGMLYVSANVPGQSPDTGTYGPPYEPMEVKLAFHKEADVTFWRQTAD